MPLNWSQLCATDHSVYLGNASHTFPVWSIPHASSDLSSWTELHPFLKKILLEGSCLETVVWTFVDAAAPGMKEEPALRSGRIKLWEKNQWMAEGKRGWRSREKFRGREKGGSTMRDPTAPKRWVLCQCVLLMLISVGLYLMLWSLNQNLFIDVYLIYHVVLVSDVQQSDSLIYIYI